MTTIGVASPHGEIHTANIDVANPSGETHMDDHAV
jgi:hypothetical protein